jgi:hypothetical protein
MIEVRMADCAEEHGVRAFRGRQRFLGQGRLAGANRSAANQRFLECKCVTEHLADAREHAYGRVVTSGPMPSPGITTIRAFTCD